MTVFKYIYYIYIHGLPIRIDRYSLVERIENNINLPHTIQLHASFIYCSYREKILKNRYQHDKELTNHMLKSCLKNSIDYIDIYDQYDLLSYNQFTSFLIRCKDKRVNGDD